MPTSGGTKSKEGLVPFHHDVYDASLGRVLEDSKFREMEQEGVIDLVRTDGSFKKEWHFGLFCYQLVIKVKDRFEEVKQAIEAILAKYGFCLVEDETTAKEVSTAIKESRRRKRSRPREVTWEETLAAAV